MEDLEADNEAGPHCFIDVYNAEVYTQYTPTYSSCDYLIQHSPAVKKVCGPQRYSHYEKDVKSKVAAKKWL